MVDLLGIPPKFSGCKPDVLVLNDKPFKSLELAEGIEPTPT